MGIHIYLHNPFSVMGKLWSGGTYLVPDPTRRSLVLNLRDQGSQPIWKVFPFSTSMKGRVSSSILGRAFSPRLKIRWLFDLDSMIIEHEGWDEHYQSISFPYNRHQNSPHYSSVCVASQHHTIVRTICLSITLTHWYFSVLRSHGRIDQYPDILIRF